MIKLDKALKDYEKAFCEMFPLFSMMCTPQDEIIATINECIFENKGVYKMGYLTLDFDILY